MKDKWFKKFIGYWYVATGGLLFMLGFSYPYYAITPYTMWGTLMMGWGLNKIYEIMVWGEDQ